MSYNFFQNTNCPFFPCHKDLAKEEFSCIHCYCPLYFIYWTTCRGNFKILDSGIKDCTGCIIPHTISGHYYILKKLEKYFSKYY